MGIYVMQAKALKELLVNKMPDADDFGNEIIPGAKDAGYHVQVRAGGQGCRIPRAGACRGPRMQATTCRCVQGTKDAGYHVQVRAGGQGCRLPRAGACRGPRMQATTCRCVQGALPEPQLPRAGACWGRCLNPSCHGPKAWSVCVRPLTQAGGQVDLGPGWERKGRACWSHCLSYSRVRACWSHCLSYSRGRACWAHSLSWDEGLPHSTGAAHTCPLVLVCVRVLAVVGLAG